MRKAIVGFEGVYEVDTEGNIWSMPKSNHPSIRKLTPHIGTNGYGSVSLCKNGTHKNYTVHRLLALTFIPNPENKPHVNHIDGNKLNNDITNLEWATESENAIHAHKNRLVNIRRGEGSPLSKLTADVILKIRADNRGSIEIAGDYSTSRQNVNDIKSGRSWKHLLPA